MRRTVPLAVASLLAVVSVSAQPRITTAPSVAADAPPVAGPCCPDETAYAGAVRAFAHGALGAAAVAIAHAPPDQLKRAVSKLSHDDPQLLPAAAAMHLILAVSALNGGNLAASAQQFRISDTLVRQIHRPSANPAFMRIWHVAATELCIASGDLDAATTIVQQGLAEGLSDGGLLLAKGIVAETQAAFDTRRATDTASGGKGLLPGQGPSTPVSSRQWSFYEGARSPLFWNTSALRRRAMDLTQAEAAYRGGLQQEPTSEEARLRLGRVLSLEGKGAEAHTLLEGLLSASHEPHIVYLAHLFLADLAVREKDDKVAAGEYTAALAANSASGVAYLALSNLAQVSGNDDQAREYIREWLAHDHGSAADPWTLYQLGTDQLGSQLNVLLRMIAQ